MQSTPNEEQIEVAGALERIKLFAKGEHFVKATGTIENIGGALCQVGKGRDTDIGSYTINNGTLTFVDEKGEYWVGMASDGVAINILKQAGYKKGGGHVPHSNDGGHWMKYNFEIPRGLTAEAIAAARETAQVRAHVAAALERIKPFAKEKYFVRATGTTENFGGTLRQIGKNSGSNMGTYGVNNGILAFVDENNDYWVGIAGHREAIAALEEAGYENRFTRGGGYVPHSNDGGHWMKHNFEIPRGLRAA